MDATPDVVEAASILPIVVGAHPRAEQTDRPIADRMRDAIGQRLPDGAPLTPVVITDVWFLNDDVLRSRPALSVGAPEVNAYAAYLADKLPSTLAVDDRLIVQMDLELVDPVASCWGADPVATAEAVRHFIDRHATAFLDAALATARGG